jgi:alkyl sulfatase BDS1-like metallo-beta-lactamase superfamily hydrolase
MGAIRELAEKFWNGETAPRDLWKPTGAAEEIAPGLVFLHTFANVSILRTNAGVVLIDTGNHRTREQTFASVRAIDPAALFAAVYTHGHVDHACGMPLFVEEAKAKGWARPQVVGHRAVAARFDRYIATNEWNSTINARQFSRPPGWPREYEYPDVVYDDAMQLGELELRHGRGETDDATWLFWPRHRVLFTGDLFIWVTPNAGNPQKVQRYAAEWAAALRAMVTRSPEILVPGHGAPIFGAARVRQALEETAEWLESLVVQTMARMNAGETLETILNEVKPPPHLAGRPYLHAVYDEPEYVIRNIWRLYGGWWDGVAANLQPAPHASIAREVAGLAGGVVALVARALDLTQQGDLRLAGHLIDWAVAADPSDKEAQAVRAAIYERRAKEARALMTRGIFSATAQEASDQSK